MVASCEQVWREISNYLEGEVGADLRLAMESHFRECKRCTAVLDGTRNVVKLFGDNRSLHVHAGFTAGWQNGLAGHVHRPRGTAFGWLLAAAAVALISGSLALARSDANSVSALRSYHAEPGFGVPDAMMVEVSTRGKTFHAPGCRFLHKHESENENVRLIAASEAIREGYAPCVRCLRQYLNR